MTIKFVSLPFDIVFHVLELLTVKDIIRLEQTCHLFRDWINERSVWALRESGSLTLFPSTSTSALSSADLRQKSIHETIVQYQWQKTEVVLKNPLKIYPNSDSFVYFAELLPGGEHILFVYENGALEFRKAQAVEGLSDPRGSPQAVPSDVCEAHGMLLITQKYTVSQSSGSEGYILIQRRHLYLRHGQNCNHVRIYAFNTNPLDLHLEPLREFLIEDDRIVRIWRRHENIFGCLYEYIGDPHVYVSLFDMSVQLVEEDRFELTDLNVERFDVAWAFAMISDTRFIVAGPKKSLFVFDTSNSNGESESSYTTRRLAPIWSFQSTIGEFQPGPIFYVQSQPYKPMMWITEGTRLLHFLVFSHGTDAVESHTVSREAPFTHPPAIGFSRALWTIASPGSITGFTLTLDASKARGSFHVDLDEGVLDMAHHSFDEVSGRLSFMVRESYGNFCMLVLDTVDRNLVR